MLKSFIKQVGNATGIVSNVPSDTKLENYKIKLGKLSDMLRLLSKNMDVYARTMIDASNASMSVARDVSHFFQKHSDNNLASCFCDGQKAINRATDRSFGEQFSWDVSCQFDRWIKEIEDTKALINKTDDMRIALERLKQGGKPLDPHLSSEYSVARTALDTQVSELIKNRFDRYQSLFVRIMELQIGLFNAGTELSFIFTTASSSFRVEHPLPNHYSDSNENKIAASKPIIEQVVEKDEEENDAEEEEENDAEEEEEEEEETVVYANNEKIRVTVMPTPTNPHPPAPPPQSTEVDLLNMSSIIYENRSSSSLSTSSAHPNSESRVNQAFDSIFGDPVPSSSDPDFDLLNPISEAPSNTKQAPIPVVSTFDSFDPMHIQSSSHRKSSACVDGRETDASLQKEQEVQWLASFKDHSATQKPMHPAKARELAMIEERVQGKVRALRLEAEVREAKQIERMEIDDQIEDRIRNWEMSNGVQKSLRALLSSLSVVLWEDSGFEAIEMSSLIEGRAIKKAYFKAVRFVHPDKMSSEPSIEKRIIAERVFEALTSAYKKL